VIGVPSSVFPRLSVFGLVLWGYEVKSLWAGSQIILVGGAPDEILLYSGFAARVKPAMLRARCLPLIAPSP
jgi:hypothetical protein